MSSKKLALTSTGGHIYLQVERFYCKVVDDLETELANMDPTVPMRAILRSPDEQEADASAEDYNTPWVMEGMRRYPQRDELLLPPPPTPLGQQ